MDKNLEKTLSSMIISASGWRGIFAENGDEESAAPEIGSIHRLIAISAARAFSLFTKNRGRSGGIIVGMDSRPTGSAIAAAVVQGLLTENREVIYTGVTAAPEIMAYARSLGDTSAGFIYISASHNPIGHNGIKFGLCDGGVLSGSEGAILAQIFRDILDSENVVERITGMVIGQVSIIQSALPDQDSIDQALSNDTRYKEEALKAYDEFTREVITGCAKKDEAGTALEAIRNGIKVNPIGIAVDFNGSARSVSIDRKFLTGLGAGFRAINDKCGEIAHAIVPEGVSLEPCKNFLADAYKEDPSFILGYVPDCDGDRGNLVIHDKNANCFRVLEAQEVFALACVAELSYLVWTGGLKYDDKGKALVKAAIAVNDPTSMRIDRIASAFDMPVFRAEVGEANVVGLARKLREEGYLVRILGEGSNGGNITHPSAVRDPINTVCAILKLLTIRSVPEKKGPYEIWCDLSGRTKQYSESFTLSDIIASLPRFVTTGAFFPQAVMKVKTADHSLLKNRYQKIFLKEWEERKDELKKHGIVKWDVTVYNGINERNGVESGLESFGEAGKGGLKIGFINDEGRKTASIWMRGSGTEPVFRILAEAEGTDESFEKYLLDWQRSMITAADNQPLS